MGGTHYDISTNGKNGSPLVDGGGRGGVAAQTGFVLVENGGDTIVLSQGGSQGVGGESAGSLTEMGWIRSGAGAKGDKGEDGKGGGGGGAADCVDAYYGPNGANGGSGGCGGHGGAGGEAGGGSIGFYAHSSVIHLVSVDFSASIGGSGGSGGLGGIGGIGGDGGIGSTERCSGTQNPDCINDVNLYNIPSGNGGKGGKGGTGGQGGGGAGGVSYGGLCSNSTVTLVNSSFTKGIGGVQGAPNGSQGLSKNQEGCE